MTATNRSTVLLFQTALLLLLLQIKCSLDASASRTNWNLAWETFPATIVVAQSAADVASCVSNEDECPTPVLAVASMRSVTSCIVNDGGSLVDLSQMNTITNFDQETGIVTCEPGVTLSDLHDYLLTNHNREISFAPEIGDATVGSLAVSTSKDSSVNGPGFFSALVTNVKYVNHNGDIITLDRELDEDAFQVFICSFGMMGIVVEVQIETREAQQILTRIYARRGISGADEAYEILRTAWEKADNVFVTLAPQQGIMLTEERYQDVSEQGFRSRMLGIFNPLVARLVQRTKFYTIQHGYPFSDFSLRPRLSNLGIFDTIGKQITYYFQVDIIHYRQLFTNRYDAVASDESRLDFSFYVYDVYEDNTNKLESTFKDTYNFVSEWYQETGYAPKGFNIYFVNRSGKKPFGEFRGPAGVSFAMDPYGDDPNSAEWRTFIEALNARTLPNDVRLSPTQTRFLGPEDFLLHREVVHKRFLTPHYAKFVNDS